MTRHEFQSGNSVEIHVHEGGIVHVFAERPTVKEWKQAHMMAQQAIVDAPRDLRERMERAHAPLRDQW